MKQPVLLKAIKQNLLLIIIIHGLKKMTKHSDKKCALASRSKRYFFNIPAAEANPYNLYLQVTKVISAINNPVHHKCNLSYR